MYFSLNEKFCRFCIFCNEYVYVNVINNNNNNNCKRIENSFRKTTINFNVHKWQGLNIDFVTVSFRIDSVENTYQNVNTSR